MFGSNSKKYHNHLSDNFLVHCSFSFWFLLLVLLHFGHCETNNSSATISSKSFSLNSYCNTLNGCHNKSLICYQSRCVCSPGYLEINGECIFIGCTEDIECSHPTDPFRMCNEETKECTECQFSMFFNEARQRCVSYLGSKCSLDDSNNEDMVYNQNLVCRNGLYVCRPDYYPNEEWTFCKKEECTNNTQCQMFSDYYRVCRRSQCVCDTFTRPNPLTFQCQGIGRLISGFMLIPFFLFPMLLMLVIVVFIFYKSLHYYNQYRFATHPNHSNVRQSSNTNQSNVPDSNKSPAAFREINLNDLPPSYEALESQRQILNKIQRERNLNTDLNQ